MRAKPNHVSIVDPSIHKVIEPETIKQHHVEQKRTPNCFAAQGFQCASGSKHSSLSLSRSLSFIRFLVLSIATNYPLSATDTTRFFYVCAILNLECTSLQLTHRITATPDYDVLPLYSTIPPFLLLKRWMQDSKAANSETV